MNKICTSIKQSKKLAEFLLLESADIILTLDENLELASYPTIRNYSEFYNQLRKFGFEEEYIKNMYIPAWSITALLDILPQEIFDGEYIINITEGCDDKWILTYDHYENRNHSYYGLSTGADNLVDACVEMIYKLHELKML